MSFIKQKGYKALIDALGVAGTVKFLQQLEVGYGNYTSITSSMALTTYSE